MQIIAKILFAVFIMGLAVGPAIADETHEAKMFVASLGYNAIKVLARSELPKEERTNEFRRILTAGFDMHLIGRYVLGRYWRRASPVERSEYSALFQEYIVLTYANQLSQYNGQTLKIKSAREDGEADVIVRSEITQAGGPPIRVDWRVRSKDETFKVIDVVVEGISMVITQRDQFASVIERAGGKVESLLVELRSRTR